MIIIPHIKKIHVQDLLQGKKRCVAVATVVVAAVAAVVTAIAVAAVQQSPLAG